MNAGCLFAYLAPLVQYLLGLLISPVRYLWALGSIISHSFAVRTVSDFSSLTSFVPHAVPPHDCKVYRCAVIQARGGDFDFMTR